MLLYLKNNIDSFLQQNEIKLIVQSIQNIDDTVYFIGGCVRDAILQRNCKDIDLVTLSDAEKVAIKLQKKLQGSKVQVFKNFGTAMFKTHDLEI